MLCGSTSRTCARMPSTWSSACTSRACKLLERADLVAENLGRHLDLHLHLVQPLLPREDDQVVRQSAFHRQQRRLPPATGRRSRRG